MVAGHSISYHVKFGTYASVYNLALHAINCIVNSAGRLYCAVCNSVVASLDTSCVKVPFLQWAEGQIAQGNVSPADVQQQVKDRIQQAGGRIDYVSITDANNLQDLKHFVTGQEVLVALACFFGSVRLIDNVVAVKQ